MAKILVIDDDTALRETLCEMLEDAGYEVAGAADGNIGISMFREQPADLVLTDIIMPGKEGVTTIGELLMDAPGLPIIAMSGGDPRGPESNLCLAPVYGAVEALQKPFSQQTLLSAVQNALAGHGSES